MAVPLRIARYAPVYALWHGRWRRGRVLRNDGHGHVEVLVTMREGPRMLKFRADSLRVQESAQHLFTIISAYPSLNAPFCERLRPLVEEVEAALT